MKTGVSAAALLLPALLMITSVDAQPASSFLDGKNLTIVIGYGPGGGFDTYARTLAEHMGRHLPGVRAVVPQNMPGAGSMRAANYVFSVAPQDGTVLGIFNENITLNQVLEPRGVQFDVRKFQWIGRLGTRPTVGMTWHTTGVRTIADATRKEVVMGSTAEADYGSQVARALNAFLATKFKLVHGYKGTKEIYLAIQRGEVGGLNFAAADELTESQPEWLRDKQAFVIHVNGVKRLPSLPDVPTIVELANTPEQRKVMTFLASKIEIGRSFVAGPGVPKDRIAALRSAFDATMRDAKFQADAKKRHVDVAPMTGDELEKLIADVLDIDPAAVERMKMVLNPN